jgi:CheY-like chemotaxis protein
LLQCTLIGMSAVDISDLNASLTMAAPGELESLFDAEDTFEGFDRLMPFRVQDILLVSNLYDSFILREDGRLNELLIGESRELNLHQIPGITHVSNGMQALELARSQPRFNLIVTNLAVGGMNAAQLAREVATIGRDIPVVVLAYDYREVKSFIARNPLTDIDRVFLWQGNARILIAIVKYVEDKRNVRHDVKTLGVPCCWSSKTTSAITPRFCPSSIPS